jgi:5-methylcytosine-specific restriction endonuclease McrA
MLHVAMGYLCAADATAMAAEAQAECLLELEQLDAVKTATRAKVLGAFTAAQGYSADGDYSPRSWLIHRTKITRGAAAAHVAWVRRAMAHPRIAAALAEAALSESYARTICGWSDKLPPDCRDAADGILVAAAAAGGHLADLAALAAEIYARSLPDEETDPGQSFDDRRVAVETTFGGAGVISGDLTPECGALVTTVLESLSAPAGAEDTRTKEQRYHDGLQEAMRRLVAGGLLPERAGQPVKVWAHVSLAELRAMDDGSVLAGQWIGEMAARWAARRAAASEGGGDGGAWLEGKAARAVACDASLTPVVTGDVDPGALDDLVRLCVQLDRLDHAADRPAPAGSGPADPQPDAWPSREALRQAIIGKAVDLLSGPGGLASFLRTRQLGARLAGPSLPLDVGFSTTIPPGIRNAVILRDRRCRWPGGCHQPAAACQVHHVKHLAHGGPTSLTDCVLLCSYHHQIVIHRWGWTLVLNKDGTTTAWNPDRTKILHSHSPPARAG